MAGSENDLTKFLVTSLIVGRLVTVRFPTCSNVAFRQSDNPTQNFEGQVYYWRSHRTLLTLPTVMALTMFFWDYILTFEMEVDLVWKSKWNLMKGLYLFQRYLPFTQIIYFFLPDGQSDVVSIFSCSILSYREYEGHFNGDCVLEDTLR
jgi:hypothetical protein